MMANPPRAESPFDALQRLCRHGASGELIFVADDTEVHVYLQSGRLAWATSSRAPLVFSRELIAQAEIDQESFRTLLDDCRKSRRPLGETLVSWGLASEEQVRRALDRQLRDALRTLAQEAAGSTLFLERSRAFAQYDQRFTFDGPSLLRELDHPGALQASEAPEPSPAALCRRVMERVPGVLWSCAAGDRTTPSSSEPQGSDIRLPEAAWRSLCGHVHMAVVRAGRGTAVGCAGADDGRHLWLGLRAEAPLGAALASLAECLDRTTAVPTRPSTSATGPVETPLGALCESCDHSLRQVVSRTRELRAVGVCEGGTPLHLVHRCGAASSETAARVLRHLDLLELGRSAAFHTRPGDMESLGFHYGTMALSIDADWHFVSEVTDGSGRLVWLWLEGPTSQGLGWALASSVNRLLAAQTCCDAGEVHG